MEQYSINEQQLSRRDTIFLRYHSAMFLFLFQLQWRDWTNDRRNVLLTKRFSSHIGHRAFPLSAAAVLTELYIQIRNRYNIESCLLLTIRILLDLCIRIYLFIGLLHLDCIFEWSKSTYTIAKKYIYYYCISIRIFEFLF